MTDRTDRLVPPAVAPTAHLGDEELTAVELSNATAKHLADCAWCQTRRDALTFEDTDDLAALLKELDAAPVPDDAIAAAGNFALPGVLASLLDADETTVPPVQPAQLWRLVWRGQDALGVVLEQNSWWVTIAPLSTDVDLADEYTAVLESDATSLRHPTAVFMRAAMTVPQFTLAHYLGDVTPDGVENASEALRTLQTACLRNSVAPDALSTGHALREDDWDRQDALDSLAELMSWFKSATTDVLDKDGSIFGSDTASGDTEAIGEEVDVVEALKKSRKELTELVERSGLEPARLLDLLQGGGKPTPNERRRLSEALGVNVTGGYTDVARLALLEIASEPAHRHLWLASNKVDELIAEEATAVAPWGTPKPRSTRARENPESLQPFLEQMFTQRVAARSVPNGGRGENDGGLAEWRAYWRDRLAMSGR